MRQLQQLSLLLQPMAAAFAVQQSASGASGFSSAIPPTAPTAPAASAAAPASVASSRPKLPSAKPNELNGEHLADLKPWIHRIASIMRYNQVSLHTTECIAYASQFLIGKARNIWTRQCERSGDYDFGGMRNWDEFCAFLKSYLDDPHPDNTARTKIHGLRQTTSVKAYADQYLALSSEIPGRTDADLKHGFIHGLKQHIKEWVEQVNPPTFDDARRVAHEADSSTFQPHSRSRYSSTSNTATPMELGTTLTSSAVKKIVASTLASLNGASTSRGRSPARTTHRRSATPTRTRSPGPSTSNRHHSRSPSRIVPLNQLSADELQQMRDDGVCFYCRKTGHQIADCPKKAVKDGKKHVRFPKN